MIRIALSVVIGGLFILSSSYGAVSSGSQIETAPSNYVPPANAPNNFYVDSKNGVDCPNPVSQCNKTGGVASPFQTIGYAQTIVRSKIGAVSGNITVWLRGGNYFRPSGSLTGSFLNFTAADSGNANQIISWAAYPGETPVISGGVALTGWVSSPVSTITGTHPTYAVSAGSTRFRQLYMQQWDPTGRVLTFGASTPLLARSRFPATPTAACNAELGEPAECAAELPLQMSLPTSWTVGSSVLSASAYGVQPNGSSAVSWMATSATPSASVQAAISQTEVVLRKTDGISRLLLNQAYQSSGGGILQFQRTVPGTGASTPQDDLEACSSLADYVANICGFAASGPEYYNTSPDFMSGSTRLTVNTASHYENNLQFIANPGDWFEDAGYGSATAGTVYVYPPNGVTFSSGKPVPSPSTTNTFQIIAPQGSNPGDNESLLSVGGMPPINSKCTSGSGGNTLGYVQFVGLTFSHTNWLWPSVNGFVSNGEPNHLTSVSSGELTANAPPAAVQLGCTTNVTFAYNAFEQLGAMGISDLIANTPYSNLLPNNGFIANSTNLTVYGNAFTQIAAGALELVGGDGNGMNVSSNLVAGVGQDYGGGGIVVNSPKALTLANNDVRYTASNGIFVTTNPYSDQGYSTPFPMAQYLTSPLWTGPTFWNIQYNIVSNAALDMNDVGGIYLWGSNNPQGSAFLPPSFFPPCTGQTPPGQSPCCPAGTPSWVPGYPECGTPKAVVQFNQVNDMPAPQWMPLWVSNSIPPAGYPAPRAIYLDAWSEGVVVAYNDLTDVASPFHLDCENFYNKSWNENLNVIVYNLVDLPSTYQGTCGNDNPSGAPNGSTILGAPINDTSVSVPWGGTPGLSSDVQSQRWAASLQAQYPTNTMAP